MKTLFPIYYRIHNSRIIRTYWNNGFEAIVCNSRESDKTEVIYIRKGGKLIETATGQGAFTWAMNFLLTAKSETNF